MVVRTITFGAVIIFDKYMNNLIMIKNIYSTNFGKKLDLIRCQLNLCRGFEPSTKVTSCNSLAGSRFQPLSHLSSSYTLSIFLQTFKIIYLIEMSNQLALLAIYF